MVSKTICDSPEIGSIMRLEPATEKLHKVMASAGLGSRRACEEMIRQGRVVLQGRTATVADRVPRGETDILVDGRPLLAAEAAVHILLYKPRGFITTARDPQGRPTVLDLVQGVPQRIYPVGRLDCDTSGLLLLTNDGPLAHALTHPSHEVPRLYRATVEGFPAPATLERLRHGIVLDDGLTAPAFVSVLSAGAARTVLELELHEGRNRQVRRMCEAVGHPVLRLERLRMGPLTLEGLEPGQWRPLTPPELEELRASAGIGPAPPRDPA